MFLCITGIRTQNLILKKNKHTLGKAVISLENHLDCFRVLDDELTFTRFLLQSNDIASGKSKEVN